MGLLRIKETMALYYTLPQVQFMLLMIVHLSKQHFSLFILFQNMFTGINEQFHCTLFSQWQNKEYKTQEKASDLGNSKY